MKTIPYIPEVLLDYLKKCYPLTDYTDANDMARMHRLHGRQDVLTFLQTAFDRQKVTDL